MESGGDPNDIVHERNLAQISDPRAIHMMIDEVIDSNQPQLQQYLSGKSKLFGFFQGQVWYNSILPLFLAETECDF